VKERTEEHYKINQLIKEETLAKSLGVSKQTLYQFRKKGCPWFSIGGKAYYHQTLFMEWLLVNQERKAETDQNL